MPNSQPLVSICIPTYNGETHLTEALQSAIDQTHENKEIIISDDQSSDRTLYIINGILNKSLIPYKVLHHSPTGIGANWNNCVKHARGQYIKFLFQDDILYPDCIATMVDLAETDSSIGLVFSRRKIIGNTSEMKFDISIFHDQYKSVISGHEILKRNDLYRNPKNKIGEPTSVLLRRSVFDQVGYFNEQLKQSLDYEYWYRVCSQYKLGYVNRELSEFRMHESQTSNKNTKVIVADKMLLPLLFIKNHFWTSHIFTKLQLIKHLVYGFFRYYIYNKL